MREVASRLISVSNVESSMMALHNSLGIRGASWHRLTVVGRDRHPNRDAAGVNSQTDGAGVATPRRLPLVGRRPRQLGGDAPFPRGTRLLRPHARRGGGVVPR